MPPGAVLAALAGGQWKAGLDQITDDELIGVLRAARRLASWAGAMELAAVGDLWRRRTGEEAAGDTGAAEHADDELAAALTLTGRAANTVLDLAIALQRLPLTAAALAEGNIDLPRARVIASELAGLSDEHAAVVEAAIIGAAPRQTTGQLCQAARRSVIAADPSAARKRKEEALRDARVERSAEPAGTAALAGRDLPPLSVLAADQNLTALATQLKDAGCEGAMDTLRASVYLALLTGTPLGQLLPASPADPGDRAGDNLPTASGSTGAGGPAGDGSTGAGQAGAGLAGVGLAGVGLAGPGAVQVKGAVNLTMPLATWLGLAQTPGHVAGYGPVDATDATTLARALATRPDTKWCLTLTDSDGHPLAHGCTRNAPPTSPHTPPATGPPPGPRKTGPPATGPPATEPPVAGPPAAEPPSTGSPTAEPRATEPSAAGQPATGPPAAGPPTHGQPATEPPTHGQPATEPPARAGDGDKAWAVTLTWLAGDCDHATQTGAYTPTPKLRHLVKIRQPTCSFPGCRRPGIRTDLDHTVPYHKGGRTCVCNLGAVCRHHHQVKQLRGWSLEQATPGVMVWTSPSGRRYTIQHQVEA